WEITAAPVPQTGYLEVPVALLAAGTTPNTGQVSILYFLAPSGGGGGGGGASSASAVTVSPTVLGAPNVEDALEALDAEVTTASSVTVSPAVLGAANVQAALVALDTEVVTAGAVTVSPVVAGGSNVQAALAGLDAKVAPLPDIAAEMFLARPQGAGTGPAQAVPASGFM